MGAVGKGLQAQETPTAAVLRGGRAVESGGEMPSPAGERGEDVDEQAVRERGGACEGQVRARLKQAIKERLLQARLLPTRLSQSHELQACQAMHSRGRGGQTSCSAAGIAPCSPPSLVLEMTQHAPASCSPAGTAACSPTALSSTSGAAAGPVCAADLNLPPADVAEGMECEAVVMDNEDTDLALAAREIECEGRGLPDQVEGRGLPDGCMAEAENSSHIPPDQGHAEQGGWSLGGHFSGMACHAGPDATGGAPGNIRAAVFLFACNLDGEKDSGADKLNGGDGRFGCLDLSLHL
ncbi:unnamed protein product [Closterium sp. Yama58-4]|nr:unnamed protein product [Closterium sp. Yama58-4]